MSKARNLSDFISDATIDSTEIADLSVTHAKLHTDMNLSSKTLTFAANQISGNSVDGGVISNFASTGIDDNASATAVTILSDGKVGIGVSSPSEPLHVAGGAVRIGNTNIRHDGSGGSWDMAFETYSGGYYERMRIGSTGNVGIGTSSPTHKLHVDGTLRTNGTVTHNAANLNLIADNARILIEEADGTDITWLGDHTGEGQGALFLYDHGGAATVKLTADSHANYINNGNSFGIGTNSPSEILHVQKASDDKLVYGSNPRLLLDTPTGINGLRVLGDTTPFEFKIDSGTYNGSTFQMGGTGDVSLLGTTTTGSATHKDSPTFFFNSMRWNGSANSTHFQGAIKGHTRSSTNGDGYLGIGANANANHLNIDASTGYVGIGTTTPYKQLQIKETSTATTSVHYPISIGGSNHNTSYATGIGFDPEGYGYRNKIAIVTEGIGAGWSRGKLHILFKDISDNNEATLADSKVTFLENGYVGVGVTSPRNKVHVAGAITSNKGITNGTGLVQTVGRGMYHILATNNYGAGSNVRHAAYYVCVDYEGDDIVATNTIFNNNNMSISFSISGGWLIAGGLPGGNNNISVFGM
jgi:hypothetical protein